MTDRHAATASGSRIGRGMRGARIRGDRRWPCCCRRRAGGSRRPPRRLRPEAARRSSMPFENVARDGRIFWLGEASAVLLTDDLNALGVGAITRERAPPGIRAPAGAARRRADRRDGDPHRSAGRRRPGGRRLAAARERQLVVHARAASRSNRPRAGERHRTRADRRSVRDLRADRPAGSRRPSLEDFRRKSSGCIRRCRPSRTTSRGCWPKRRRRRSTI